jgi:hypothetical protein
LFLGFFYNFLAYLLRCFLSISDFIFMSLRIQNPVLKYPVFVKTSKIQKTMKKNFVHTAKCLKAKKSYCVFYTPKKQCFSMHFGFNNQFIKVKRTLAKISKNNKKFYFVLSFSIRGTILHVIHIPDIKSFFNVRTVRFYPIR